VARATALDAYFGQARWEGDAPSLQQRIRAEDPALDWGVEQAQDGFAEAGRRSRLLLAGGIALGALAVLGVIGIASWRALVAALAGTAVYQILYNGLYFLVHGHRWSLSAFNEEDLIESFFYTRMGEAVLAALLAAAVAALVYVALRRDPKGPRGEFLAGWLSLGVATVLAIMVSQALQIAWYVWAWGVEVTWWLPDLMWGFKFDLDLVQTTALGVAALLAPVVTYLVGRYHPRLRTAMVAASPAAAAVPEIDAATDTDDSEE
jgi:cell shape-determining protein MreD